MPFKDWKTIFSRKKTAFDENQQNAAVQNIAINDEEITLQSLDLVELKNTPENCRGSNTQIVIVDRDNKQFQMYLDDFKLLLTLSEEDFNQKIKSFLVNKIWHLPLKVFNPAATVELTNNLAELQDNLAFVPPYSNLTLIENIKTLRNEIPNNDPRYLLFLGWFQEHLSDAEATIVALDKQAKTISNLRKSFNKHINHSGTKNDCKLIFDFLDQSLKNSIEPSAENLAKKILNSLYYLLTIVDDHALSDSNKVFTDLSLQVRGCICDFYEYFLQLWIDKFIKDSKKLYETNLPAAADFKEIPHVIFAQPPKNIPLEDFGEVGAIFKSPMAMGTNPTFQPTSNDNNRPPLIVKNNKPTVRPPVIDDDSDDDNAPWVTVTKGAVQPAFQSKSMANNNSADLEETPQTLMDVISPSNDVHHHPDQLRQGYNVRVDLDGIKGSENNAKQRLIEIQHMIFYTNWSTGLGGLWVTMEDADGKEICSNTVPTHMKRMLDEINVYFKSENNKGKKLQDTVTASQTLKKIKELAKGEHAKFVGESDQYTVWNSTFFSQIFYGNRRQTIGVYQMLQNISHDICLRSEVGLFNRKHPSDGYRLNDLALQEPTQVTNDNNQTNSRQFKA